MIVAKFILSGLINSYFSINLYIKDLMISYKINDFIHFCYIFVL